MSTEPYFDQRSQRWTVTIKGESLVHNERFVTEAEAREYCGLSGGSTEPSYRPEEVKMSKDVQHLGAVGLDVIPLALSTRACNFIIDQIDGLLQAGVLGEEDHSFADKLLGELRNARDATLSKTEHTKGGITPAIRKAAGLRVTEVSDEDLAAASPTYAEAVADKMAKSARKAVEK